MLILPLKILQTECRSEPSFRTRFQLYRRMRAIPFGLPTGIRGGFVGDAPQEKPVVSHRKRNRRIPQEIVGLDQDFIVQLLFCPHEPFPDRSTRRGQLLENNPTHCRRRAVSPRSCENTNGASFIETKELLTD